jgi:small-conductance mechanosensitive channel
LSHSLGISPKTSNLIADTLAKPLAVILILFITFVTAYASNKFMEKSLVKIYGIRQSDTESLNRLKTIAHMVSRALRAVIWIIGILIGLQTAGVNLLPLIAGASVVGAAIAFGAQNLVKDYLAGFLIVLEDQLKLGDTIVVAETEGSVIAMSLRITTLKTSDGSVAFVANGDIRKLINKSKSNLENN